MKPNQIRAIAICVFRDDDRLLLAEWQDPLTGETFYRPLGGGIEFGELSTECIVREIREEIGVEVTDLTYLATIENVFTYNNQPGHEIVLVYEACLADPTLYQVESVIGDDNGSELVVVWKSIDHFRAGQSPLYPTGLLELLDE
ncbi:MAG: NUDIX hydrolase [Chloroflexi bacterium]|nr:NUDIX hydrolase [Chloroflexota bacterium]